MLFGAREGVLCIMYRIARSVLCMCTIPSRAPRSGLSNCTCGRLHGCRDFQMHEEEISIMTKRILASVLCLCLLVSSLVCLSACGDSKDKKTEDKGQYLTMYLSDQVYDLDPANAFYNDGTTTIVNLLFETLFKINENGKVKKSLVQKYVIKEDAAANEYRMDIYLNETCWSDGTYVSANDVVYAWKRVLDVESSYDAAALLYDIKNARSVKEGDMSIDDLCIYAEGERMISVEFEGPINYDQFILNLTSVALAPLREDITSKPDWAKKPATIVCSGPFKLGRVTFVENTTKYFDGNYEYEDVAGNHIVGKDFKEALIKFMVLERNSYYYRNAEKEEKLDKFVTPYRIIVDFSMTDEQVADAYEAGAILYVDNIPYSWRVDPYYTDMLKDVDVTDAMSNHTYFFNQNALIDNGGEGEYLFANKTVRQVLSKAIDRQAIAEAVMYAEAATGIVPNGVFNTDSSKDTFREAVSSAYETLTTVDVDTLKSELKSAGITPKNYTFSITVAAYDEMHVVIAEMVAEQWEALGFDVKLNLRGTILNNDFYKWTDSVPNDICDDLYMEDLVAGNYEVAALDMGAITMDAYATLAPFAKAFSGQGMDMSDSENYKLSAHITGFDNQEYNDLMEAVYFLQYYNDFYKFFYNTAYGTDYFDSKEAADAVYNKIGEIYGKYNITPNAKSYLEDRATLLHAAEDILMDEVPVTPIIANQYASLSANNINKVKGTYTNPIVLTKTTASGYKSYLEKVEDFLEANFQAYCEDKQSYIYNEFKSNDKVYSAGEFSYEGFKGESSHYSFLFEGNKK